MNKVEAIITPEAIQTAKNLVATGSFCRQRDMLPSETPLTLFALRQIFPYIGPCVVNWAMQHQSEAIGKVEILSALAGDFHLELTRQAKEFYQRAYYLTDNFAEFCLFHLVNVGRLVNGKQLVCRGRHANFALLADKALAANYELVAIHLGRVVCRLDEREVRQIEVAQEREPETNKLLEQFAGQTVRVFNEQRR